MTIMGLVAPFLQVEVSELPVVFCKLGALGFYRQIQFVTIMPLVIMMIMSLPSAYVVIRGIISHGGSFKHPKFSDAVNALASSLMMFLFLIYTSVSSKVVRCFKCIDYGMDGSVLQDDHRIQCSNFNDLGSNGSDDYVYILGWASVFFVLYPIGIPLVVLFSMWRSKIPHMASTKINYARFLGLLQLRKSQVGTMTRAICANAVGRVVDEGEFDKRARFLYSTLYRSVHYDDPGDDSIMKFDPQTLCHAIAKVAGLPFDAIAIADVQDLVRTYDLDQDGLSVDEFSAMLLDLTAQVTLFTGYESLDKLSTEQLETLYEHDWTQSNKLNFTEHEPNRVYEGLQAQTPISKASLNRIHTKFQRVKKSKNVLDSRTVTRTASMNNREQHRAEMIEWLRRKAIQLEKVNKLRRPPAAWFKTGSDQERNAIARFGFVFMAYKVNFWYFELIWLGYKLTMSSLVILSETTEMQLFVASMATFAFMLLHLTYQPLTTDMLNRLMCASLVVTFFNFISVMPSDNVQRQDVVLLAEIGSYIVTTLNFVIVGYPVLHFLLDVRSLQKSLEEARYEKRS